MTHEDLQYEPKQAALRSIRAGLLALALLPAVALAAVTGPMVPDEVAGEPTLEVPSWAADYRESVRCMPSIRSAGVPVAADPNAAELSLEEQETALRLIPLWTSIDGDRDPDVLVYGAESYRDSVACTAQVRDTLASYGVSVRWMPTASLEHQEDLDVEPLPATEETIPAGD